LIDNSSEMIDNLWEMIDNLFERLPAPLISRKSFPNSIAVIHPSLYNDVERSDRKWVSGI
jgi:hypothetical protein